MSSPPNSREPRVSDEELAKWVEVAERFAGGKPYQEGPDGVPMLNGRPWLGAAVFDLRDCRQALAEAQREIGGARRDVAMYEGDALTYRVRMEAAEATAGRRGELLEKCAVSLSALTEEPLDGAGGLAIVLRASSLLLEVRAALEPDGDSTKEGK